MYHIGPSRRICIVVDNAPWHCELEDDSKPARRSWTKQKIRDWLSVHGVSFDESCSKAELLELALANRPVKCYKVNPGKETHDYHSSLMLISDRSGRNAI